MPVLRKCVLASLFLAAGLLAETGVFAEPLREGASIRIEDEVRVGEGRIDLHVEFVCRDRERRVNMDTLEISYLNMFGLDITHLVRPYIRQNKIIADGLEFPPGEHRFNISIRDDRDIETTQAISVRVH